MISQNRKLQKSKEPLETNFSKAPKSQILRSLIPNKLRIIGYLGGLKPMIEKAESTWIYLNLVSVLEIVLEKTNLGSFPVQY